MKYLKSYKLFESNWYDMKEYMNVLGDLSLSLWDKDFNVQIADEIISREHQCLVVNIVKRGSNKFSYPEIKEELLEMIDYMKDQGWEILNMEFTHIAAGPLYCKLDGDKLVSAISEEEIDYQFHQLIVKFVEKKEVKTNESTEESIHREMMIKKYGLESLEECDSIISDIKDMLLELNDLEIFTSIDYTPLTYMCVENKSKLFLNIKADSKLWESNSILIDEVINTIKELIRSYGYVNGSNIKKEERVGLIDIYEVEYQMLIQK